MARRSVELTEIEPELAPERGARRSLDVYNVAAGGKLRLREDALGFPTVAVEPPRPSREYTSAAGVGRRSLQLSTIRATGGERRSLHLPTMPEGSQYEVDELGVVTVPAPAPAQTVQSYRASLEIAGAFQTIRASMQLPEKERAAIAAAVAPPPHRAGAPALKGVTESDDHAVDLKVLIERLGVDINEKEPTKSKGLTAQEAATRLERDGKNTLSPPKQRSELVKFLLQFANVFMILLNAAGVLSCIAYAIDTSQGPLNLYLGIVLFVLVFITCLVTWYQEGKNSAVMAQFAKMLPQAARVYRDGTQRTIPAEDIAIGDVLTVGIGEKVPADMRIVSCVNMKVDNSSITGESEAISLETKCTDKNPLETKNLAFYGSLCVDGEGTGIVIKTGDRTLIGQIARLAGQTKSDMTTLQREVNRFVYFITGLSIVTGVVFLVLGFVRKFAISTNLVNVIGMVIANVPQGLPATVTACLMIAAKKLIEENVFVKKLEYVETLGSCSVIVSDKTGTLTQNRMTVSHMWYDDRIFGVDPLLKNDFTDVDAPSYKNLFMCASCCNRAHYDGLGEEEDDGTGEPQTPMAGTERKINGDASESAIFRYCDAVVPVARMRFNNHKVFEIRFNSTNKWQLSIHRPLSEEGDQSRTLLMKGAPEILIKRCTAYMHEGQVYPMTPEFLAKFENAYKDIGSKGERCLGFGMKKLSVEQYPPSMDNEYDTKKNNYPMADLVFVGLISLIDPPRQNVPEAVADCKTAGIKVIMCTGDHPLTAKAIARQVGIIAGDTVEDIADREGVPVESVDTSRATAVVVPGYKIPELTVEQWDSILVKKEIVFARMSPEQKLILVTKCQEKGAIVAVTGDGVNDSPALKKADIGVAMGIVGSDVAKEAASIILMDDNFASIVLGIREGRRIFDNLAKSIAYTITHLGPELLPFALNVIAGMPLGLSAQLVLCIDLFTEEAPAISLAYETMESDIMRRPPRHPTKDRMVSGSLICYSYLEAGILQMVGCMTSYLVLFNMYGFPLSSLPGSVTTYFQPGAPAFMGIPVEKQLEALSHCQSSFFLAIVIGQVFNLLCCKTRTRSIFKHGMRNMTLNVGILVALGLGVFFVYVPFMQSFLMSFSVSGWFWLTPLPAGVILFCGVEFRKFLNRRKMCMFLRW